MKNLILSSIVILCTVAMLRAQNSVEIKSKINFRKSAVALMPEGEPENLETFLPLSPEIVAWGIDPIHFNLDETRLNEHFGAYKNIGITYLACNVWMLTATDRYMYRNPELQDAVCKDIEGNKIIPGWLDSEYNGVKPWWGCTNHPVFRELVVKRASLGIANGANLLHLDDHMGTAAAASHSGGCFCEYCMSGFNKWLKNNCSKEQLAELGILDINKFNYAEMLKNKGYVTLNLYKKAVANKSLPLRTEFMNFQLYEAAEFVNELGKIADSVTMQHVPLGVNSWNLDPTQLATSHYADYFSNEVSHYDLEDTNPPFVYLLADALEKPVFSTGTGEDWIKINHNPSSTRINRWIATAYAHGHYFMYSYNKWGFSEETGTQWYQIPIEFYKPYCTFINENKELFDGFEPMNQVGILYENEICRAGNWQVKEICRELNYLNIPVGIAASGDEWMKKSLVIEDLKKFEYLIIPEKTNLSAKENEIINSFTNDGGKILNWPGNNELEEDAVRLISVQKASKIWALPRTNKSRSNTEKARLVIHLLNQDYSPEQDKMNGKNNFEIHLNNKLSKEFSFNRATLFTPGKEPVTIKFSDTENERIFEIPTLDVWAILQLE